MPVIGLTNIELATLADTTPTVWNALSPRAREVVRSLTEGSRSVPYASAQDKIRYEMERLAQRYPDSKPDTMEIRRDAVEPGMIIHSPHGYRLLVTEVRDSAENRSDDRHVYIAGHLHANPERPIRSEAYAAKCLTTVEI